MEVGLCKGKPTPQKNTPPKTNMELENHSFEKENVHLPTPPKSNIDTQNDGFENVSPFKDGYLGFQPLVFGDVGHQHKVHASIGPR